MGCLRPLELDDQHGLVRESGRPADRHRRAGGGRAAPDLIGEGNYFTRKDTFRPSVPPHYRC
jgi:hypothetical protein